MRLLEDPSAAAVTSRLRSGGPVSGWEGLGECLLGRIAPNAPLPFVPGELLSGTVVSLRALARRGSLAVSFYPELVPLGAEAGQDLAGVEVERVRAQGWRGYGAELGVLGYRVVGVSAQSAEVQARFGEDWLLGFTLLSDTGLFLADELGVPTKRGSDGLRVFEALTILIRDGRVSRVFDPAACGECDAAIVTASIREHRA